MKHLSALAALLFLTPVVRAAIPFTPVAPMTYQHAYHGAFMLSTGKVFVTGGTSTTGHWGSSELYDPVKNTWSAAPDQSISRYSPTSVLMANGKVLTVGGLKAPVSGQYVYLPDAEFYDPKLGFWLGTSPMKYPRLSPTLTSLPGGKVLAVGGVPANKGNLLSTEIYNPTLFSWSDGPPSSVIRRGHTATVLKSGKVLIVGGYDFTVPSILDTVEIYDPVKNTMTLAAHTKHVRVGHTATLLLDGRVLVAGGDGVDVDDQNLVAEIYDPVLNTWTDTGSLPALRSYAVSVLLPHGKVLVTGGLNNQSNAVATALLYDPVSGLWTPAGTMALASTGHVLTPLGNGDVLVTGGQDSSYNSAPNQIYGLGDLHGAYYGLVSPAPGTSSELITQGSLSATVQPTRTFTAKLLLDGQTLNLAGKFDEEGNARFTPGDVTTFTILRTNKPSFVIAMHIERQGPAGQCRLLGTVTRMLRAAVVAVSNIDASPAVYDGKTPATTVPAEYLGKTNADGVFNVILPASALVDQPPGFALADYPQGTGYATAKITKAGAVSFSGKLADGTAFTLASALNVRTSQLVPAVISSTSFPLFAQLYGGLGFLATTVTLDSTNAQSDFSAAANGVLWSKPYQTVQWYLFGWPEVIHTQLSGAKFTVTPGQSIVPGITPPAVGDPGNAYLAISKGLISTPFNRGLIISSADAVTKIDIHDTAYTLAITRATGLFSGVFLHSDATKPAYQGIIYQKGINSGGHGYFLTTQPKVKTYTGESGLVRLTTSH